MPDTTTLDRDEHPAAAAQRIVDEVLRGRYRGVEADLRDQDPDDAGAIARRIVDEVIDLHDRETAATAAPVTPAATDPVPTGPEVAEIVDVPPMRRLQAPVLGPRSHAIAPDGTAFRPQRLPSPDLTTLLRRAAAPLRSDRIAAADDGVSHPVVWVLLAAIWLIAIGAFGPMLLEGVGRSVGIGGFDYDTPASSTDAPAVPDDPLDASGG